MSDARGLGLQLKRSERDRLTAAGVAAFPGFTLRLLARTPSTQDVVRAAARAGAAEGFSCVAAEQSAGRGRQGRVWSAPAGTSLMASVLLRPQAAALPGVPIAAGLAIASAIVAMTGVDVRLKWPNDLLVDGAKLSGILAEVAATPDGPAVVLGFAVNLTVDTFPEGANGTSLHVLCPDTVPSWHALLAAVMTDLARHVGKLTSDGLPSLLPAWRAQAAGLGGVVTAMTPTGAVTGIATDIGDDGALLVETPAGTIRLVAGDVHIGSRPREATAVTIPLPSTAAPYVANADM